MNKETNLDAFASLSLLYVEDDIDIREELESFFELRVKKLYVAKDGKEGLELFQKHTPDLVISDVNMPKMNGIEMSKQIKSIDKNIPIVLVTAFSDARYMMEAISVGINKYVLKPVDISNLEEIVATIAEDLNNKKIAEKSKKDKEIIENLNSFMQFSPNPIIIYEGDDVKFVNKAFVSLSKMEADDLLEKKFELNKLFEKRDDTVSSLDALKLNYKENKVSIKSEYGRRIFYLMSDEIKTEHGHDFRMYTFNDITVSEYQKLKIKHYNLRLEDFIKHVNKVHVKKYEESNSTISNEAVKEKVEQVKLVTKEKAEQVTKERRELSQMEESVLKKSRLGVAFSAQEYSSEVDEYILDDIRELSLMENEVADLLGIYELKKDKESLFSISMCLVKYSSVVSQLFEFEDLSFSIKALADLLANANFEMMDDSKHRKIEMFLSGMMGDLMDWRMTIFVDKSAQDIHYLDASLFSAILQLELVISEKEAVVADADDDDDFELF